MAFPPRTWFLGQLVTAADMNADVRDNINTLLGGGVVPTGLITDWGDQIANIPTTVGVGAVPYFHDCDGTSPTLNLHDYFIISAGGTYAVGATGGATSVTPTGHTDHVLTQPPHSTHTVGGGSDHSHTPNNIADGGAGNAGAGLNSSPQHGGQALSAHDGFAAHTAIIDSGGPDVHLHTALATMPPYHALAKMQKLSSGLSSTTPRTWVSTEVNTAAQFNAELRDNPNYLIANVLALKTILMWSGSLAALPAGWQLCDGTNGTPDLRDKFVVTAGDTYAVNVMGGAPASSLAAHSNHIITQATGHTNHTATQAVDHASSFLPTTAGAVAVGVFTHTGFAVNAHSAHANFNLGAHSLHQFGGVSTTSTLPPFVALAYIMLTSVAAVTTPKTWTTSEVVQQSEFNTYIRDNENAINAAQMPLFSAAWWSGSIGSIPANYADGGHDQFIIGAGLTYAPLATGGAASVTPDSHTGHTVTQPSAHTAHVITQPSAHTSAITFNGSTPGPLLEILTPTSLTHSFTVDSGLPDVHVHAFSVDTHTPHGAISVLPPYYGLALIVRIS